MISTSDGDGVFELELEKKDVQPPTERLREFAVRFGDRDLNDGIETGGFEHQLRLAVARP